MLFKKNMVMLSLSLVLSSSLTDAAITRGRLNHVSSKTEFDIAIAEGDVVVKFSATWCGPCKALEPHVKSAAQEFKEITFIEIDTDEHRDLSRRYNIKSIPTILFFRDSRVAKTLNGSMSKARLVDEIKQVFGK